MPNASLIMSGSMQHPTVRLIRGAIAVQGAARDGPEGHHQLRGSKGGAPPPTSWTGGGVDKLTTRGQDWEGRKVSILLWVW